VATVDTDTPLAPLVADPGASAILLDVDGTLAPIAPTPELAFVPDDAKAELERLVRRYALVACISGRSGPDASRLVGVDGIRYVGNHGLELDPEAVELASAIATFRDTVTWPVEDKVLSLSYHYRTAVDEDAALAELDVVAQRAREAGLDARWGRKVLEIRPLIDSDKGTAVRALVAETGVRNALFAGDDATDLDAFEGLTTAGLDHAVRIAVASAEGPSLLSDEADLVVQGTGGMVDVLKAL
jgi:trehalose 6-phosphate phosphatase